ncbi:MAG TPA: hypothetical protein VF516_14760 [Kofleriaceae bacterium]
MDGLLRVLTWICAAIPLVVGLAATRAPAPARAILFGVAVAMLAMYAFIWLWMRPTGFVVAPEGLVIDWPVRRRRIQAAAVTAARILNRDQLQRELGRIVRISCTHTQSPSGRQTGEPTVSHEGSARAASRWVRAGQDRAGLVELWVSRTDWMVLVECTGRRSLLITPVDRAVRERTGSSRLVSLDRRGCA